MSQVTEQSVRFQTALASIKLIQASAVVDITEDDFDFLTSNKVLIATDRSRARRCVESCVSRTLDFVVYSRFSAPLEFIAAVIAYYFFFQAKDGIRLWSVTGVQTCALPISVIEAIHRQLMHYAEHVGQIIFLAKHYAGANWRTLSVPRKPRA